MDYQYARHNMVQQQINTWNVFDANILRLMSELEREYFPLASQELAYSEDFLPLGHKQFMLPPPLVGRALQELKLSPKDHVLQIGTGSGYITALLAKLSKQVTAIEIIPELKQATEYNLKRLEITNVNLLLGDGLAPLAKSMTFDAILLTGSVYCLPKHLRETLNLYGKIFVVLNSNPQVNLMQAMLLTKVDKEHWREQNIFETSIPDLINAPVAQTFSF